MAWDKASKANYAALRHESKTTLARLSSTERLKFMSFGEVPRYFNSAASRLVRAAPDGHRGQGRGEDVVGETAGYWEAD